MRIAARPAARPASSTSGRLCSTGTGLSSFLKRAPVELSADSGGKHFCAWALGREPFKMVQAVWKQRTGAMVKRAIRGACSLSVQVFKQETHVGHDF